MRWSLVICSPQKDAQVYEWILTNKVAVRKEYESMIASVKESAGLGSPPISTSLTELSA